MDQGLADSADDDANSVVRNSTRCLAPLIRHAYIVHACNLNTLLLHCGVCRRQCSYIVDSGRTRQLQVKPNAPYTILVSDVVNMLAVLSADRKVTTYDRSQTTELPP